MRNPAVEELTHLYPYINRKGITVEIKIEDGYTLLADASLLSIIMRNIISNAVKFTYHSGNIEIGTAGETQGRMKGFYVKDSGRGMDKNGVTSILEGRADKIGGHFGTDGETGTGLGLMLCREFIQISRGKFLIESTPGSGTTVTVLLPEG
jgi:two-component system sensor histidine kinase/response regulator